MSLESTATKEKSFNSTPTTLIKEEENDGNQATVMKCNYFFFFYE